MGGERRSEVRYGGVRLSETKLSVRRDEIR